MDRQVTAPDGREWTVRKQLEWRPPVTAEDFEHDVSGGARPGYVMLGILGVLVAVLVIWMPDGVYVPVWFVLALALVALFFPLRWTLRRPWTVVAETEGLQVEPAVAGRWGESVDTGTADGENAESGEVSSAEDGESGSAEDEEDPYPAERWVGTVRGMLKVHSEVARVAKTIERHSTPDPTGPLRPVD
ncbi:DUF983 domain-containing protein [Haloechinothrix sp. LS1_15]|uniref:DUF983 domain-containing protein n=1 Tax=Haloechinothrix sp. LS1_15 TaxID=2652248 RepID=UPI00294769BD|nr:DUF983 domain-containing protein [Haloechinothrix sp. LS1_15]MDV6014543.1 DUF983 domain-containing protein [Haloechinothrix sp. LS1_15]